DPAFHKPSKPIGPAFSAEAAARLPYPTVSTPKGYRRVVASPEPVTIVEKREIRQLMQWGFIVITCGGGGIPVVREGRHFAGIDAVIDKDLASAQLAREVDVDLMVIATDVEGVALNFGRSGQQFLADLDVERASRLLCTDEFPAGSMGPKVEACTRFLRHGGKRAVICSVEAIEEAVAGRAGTQLVKG
ncbi:MAG TPA: carbamate kinase, partial [Syntrophobacteraceae bacterium]|nr:carbamate kinase [Syntrophobacteraceae bacterium]